MGVTTPTTIFGGLFRCASIAPGQMRLSRRQTCAHKGHEARSGFRRGVMFRLCQGGFAESPPAIISETFTLPLVDGAARHAEFHVGFEPCLEIRNDVWCASVSRVAQRLSAKFSDPLTERRARRIETTGHPHQESAHGLRVITSVRRRLAFAELRSANRSFGKLENQQPRPNRMAPRDVFAGGQDESSGRFDSRNRAVESRRPRPA